MAEGEEIGSMTPIAFQGDNFPSPRRGRVRRCYAFRNVLDALVSLDYKSSRFQKHLERHLRELARADTLGSLDKTRDCKPSHSRKH